MYENLCGDCVGGVESLNIIILTHLIDIIV
jgi:hypothetical protein